jgi:hypothetical protein
MKSDVASRPGMEKGYIKLWRKFRDNPLWREDRILSRAEAFLDLLMSANGTCRTILFDGKSFLIKRGQLLTSRQKLANKWGWSKTKTSVFLDYLQKSDRSINLFSDHRKTIITFLNYDVYNRPPEEKKTSPGRQKKITEKPLKNHRVDTTNKDKIKKNLSPDIFSLVDLLIEKMKENDPEAKVPKTQNQREKWGNEFWLLVERDGRPIDEVKEVLIWSQRNSFWKGNIFSPAKLREKYPQLRLKMIEEQGKQGKQESFTDEEYDAYIKQHKEMLKR